MRFLTAFLAACLCASVAVAQPACEPGRSVKDLVDIAAPLVESGQVAEALVLEGASLQSYVKALQAAGLPVPDGLSHMVVVIRKDRTAAIFGFKNGCYDGKAQLGPGLHQKARGQEV